MTNVSKKEQLQAQLAFYEANREQMGVGYDAAVKAILGEQQAVKRAEQKAKWEPFRVKLTAFVRSEIKGLNDENYPGLRIELSNFNENGENASGTLVMSTSKMDSDGKTNTEYLFGAPIKGTRTPRTGKTYRGEIVLLEDILLGDGTVRVSEDGIALTKGTKFPGTTLLATAAGHGKGKWGYYNELRSHGQKRGEVWEYTEYISDQSKAAEKGTEG